MPLRGRPLASGTFPTLADFERDALAALWELRNEGGRLTQRNVAARLGLSYDRTRELLKELKEQHAVSWQDLKKRAQ